MNFSTESIGVVKDISAIRFKTWTKQKKSSEILIFPSVPIIDGALYKFLILAY